VFGRKKWSGAVFLNLELLGALPNTPLVKSQLIGLFDFFVFAFCNIFLSQ
jgi:hypothetical protein